VPHCSRQQENERDRREPVTHGANSRRTGCLDPCCPPERSMRRRKTDGNLRQRPSCSKLVHRLRPENQPESLPAAGSNRGGRLARCEGLAQRLPSIGRLGKACTGPFASLLASL